jgi:hypothetical protein
MPRLVAPLLACTLLASLTACTVCREEIVDQSTSPDGQWTTRTTMRACGSVATTNVYLQRADSRVRLGEIVVLLRRVHPLRISWSSAAQIQVTCDGCAQDVRVLRASAHGISVAMSR